MSIVNNESYYSCLRLLSGRQSIDPSQEAGQGSQCHLQFGPGF